MELKGTRHLVLAWVPIILAAMIIGGIIAIALNTILRQLGLDLPYIAEFIGTPVSYTHLTLPTIYSV